MAVEKEKPYLDDYFRKGMLLGGVLRSKKAKAKIKNIVFPTSLPLNCYIITQDDIPGEDFISIRDNKIPVLSSHFVQYEGEAIALVVAPDSYTLEEILSLIEVEYEEEQAYFDNNTNIEERIVKQESMIKGSPDEIFKTAENIISGEYSTGTQEHFHSDFSGAIAEYRKDGLNIITSSEWIFHARKSVAKVLAVKEESIKVLTAEYSPSYGAKMWFPSLLAAQAAIMAAITKKTVKLIIPKQDEIRVAPKRAPVSISYKTAVDKDGEYLASEVEIAIQAGAYSTITDEMLNIYIKEAMGAYHSKNISVSGKLYLTNTPPMDIYTNIGLSPVMFAAEMQNFLISKKLNLDLYQLKLKNLIVKTDDVGEVCLDNTDNLLPEDFSLENESQNINKEILDRVSIISDYKRKQAAFPHALKNPTASLPILRRGIGLSIAYQGNEYQNEFSSNKYCLNMVMRKNEAIDIYTSALPESLQVLFHWKEIAASILKIKIKNVNIVYTNTDLIPDSGRFLYYPKTETISQMIEIGVKKIAAKRFRDPLPLSVTVGRNELTENIACTDGFRTFTFASAVVEVQINSLTNEVETKSISMVLDAGLVRNEVLAKARLKQSILDSLNWCTIDQRPKNLLSRKIYTYKQTRLTPKINIDFIKTDCKMEKGIEEIAYSTVPAAFLVAVSQAAMTPHYSIPIDPFNVFRSL